MQSQNLRRQIVSKYSKILEQNKYSNFDKLSEVFSMWLKQYSIAISCYNRTTGEELNLFAHFSTLDNIQFRSTLHDRVPKDSFVKRTIKYILSISPTPYAVLPGGRTRKLDDLISLITIQKLRRLRLITDIELFNQFRIEIGPIIRGTLFESLFDTCPKYFFSKPIYNNLFPRIVRCSPICFFEMPNLKSLFLSKTVTIQGIQHGGNYGEFKENHFEKYEVKISNIYHHWGLGKRNVRQNRYPSMAWSSALLKGIARIEPVTPNAFIKNLIPIYAAVKNNPPRQIDNFLIKRLYEIPYYILKHPKVQVMEPRKTTGSSPIIKSMKDMSKNNISSLLFLLDSPGQTFMYQAIYQNLPFIMLLERKMTDHFTEKYLDLLKLFESSRIMFYRDQEEKMLKYIKSYLAADLYPKEIFQISKDYLESDNVCLRL